MILSKRLKRIISDYVWNKDIGYTYYFTIIKDNNGKLDFTGQWEKPKRKKNYYVFDAFNNIFKKEAIK